MWFVGGAAAILTSNDLQLIGEKRMLCYQMMEEFEVTELEATNIINGYHAGGLCD